MCFWKNTHNIRIYFEVIKMFEVVYIKTYRREEEEDLESGYL